MTEQELKMQLAIGAFDPAGLTPTTIQQITEIPLLVQVFNRFYTYINMYEKNPIPYAQQAHVDIVRAFLTHPLLINNDINSSQKCALRTLFRLQHDD